LQRRPRGLPHRLRRGLFSVQVLQASAPAGTRQPEHHLAAVHRAAVPRERALPDDPRAQLRFDPRAVQGAIAEAGQPGELQRGEAVLGGEREEEGAAR